MVTKLKCRWNLIDAVGLPKDKVISILLHLMVDETLVHYIWMRESNKCNYSDLEFVFFLGSLTYKQTL